MASKIDSGDYVGTSQISTYVQIFITIRLGNFASPYSKLFVRCLLH